VGGASRIGQVVVVNVPFTDQTGAKRRPALVVSAETNLSRVEEGLARSCGFQRSPKATA
jgi:hypothetical protein